MVGVGGLGGDEISHAVYDGWCRYMNSVICYSNRVHVPTPPVINSMRDLIPTQPPTPSIKNLVSVY